MRQQSRSKKNNSRQVAFTRFMFVVAFFVLWLGGISVRLVHLQVNQHGWLKERAIGVRQNVKQTRMLRGTIYDRNERALAMSLPVKTLYADPKEIEARYVRRSPCSVGPSPFTRQPSCTHPLGTIVKLGPSSWRPL